MLWENEICKALQLVDTFSCRKLHCHLQMFLYTESLGTSLISLPVIGLVQIKVLLHMAYCSEIRVLPIHRRISAWNPSLIQPTCQARECIHGAVVQIHISLFLRLSGQKIYLRLGFLSPFFSQHDSISKKVQSSHQLMELTEMCMFQYKCPFQKLSWQLHQDQHSSVLLLLMRQEKATYTIQSWEPKKGHSTEKLY